MIFNKQTQRGVSLLEVSLSLLLVAYGAINVANQLSDKIRLNKLKVVVSKVNNFSVSVETYLRDHKGDSTLDGVLLTPKVLADQNYLPDGVESTYLTTQDMLVAAIKYDPGSKELRALIYNKCMVSSCDQTLTKSAKMIDSQIGYGGGVKVTENKVDRIKGNFDSWTADVKDWQSSTFDLTYPSIFKLVKYTPIPNGRFSPDAASVTSMNYTVTSAGVVSASLPVDENKSIDWKPLYTNDTLNIRWQNNGVSYIIINLKDVTAPNNPIDVRTQVVFASSIILDPKPEDFGKKFALTATTYDENGQQGHSFTLHFNVERYTASIWKSFIVTYYLDIFGLKGTAMKQYLSCSSIYAINPPVTNTYFGIMELKGFLAGNPNLPAGTLYLETQKIELNLPQSGQGKSIDLYFNDPNVITHYYRLGTFGFQYNSSPLLSLIKIKPDNSDFTSLVIPNCHPESAITNITFKVDNSAYVITVDPKNPKTYAQYTITLTASN